MQTLGSTQQLGMVAGALLGGHASWLQAHRLARLHTHAHILHARTQRTHKEYLCKNGIEARLYSHLSDDGIQFVTEVRHRGDLWMSGGSASVSAATCEKGRLAEKLLTGAIRWELSFEGQAPPLLGVRVDSPPHTPHPLAHTHVRTHTCACTPTPTHLAPALSQPFGHHSARWGAVPPHQCLTLLAHHHLWHAWVCHGSCSQLAECPGRARHHLWHARACHGSCSQLAECPGHAHHHLWHARVCHGSCSQLAECPGRAALQEWSLATDSNHHSTAAHFPCGAYHPRASTCCINLLLPQHTCCGRESSPRSECRLAREAESTVLMSTCARVHGV